MRFGLSQGNLSVYCAFKLASRRAFLPWVKSLKEVFYKFFNASRTLAFPQRGVNANDCQAAALQRLLCSDLGRWLWELWQPGWFGCVLSKSCAGRSLLRRLIVQTANSITCFICCISALLGFVLALKKEKKRPKLTSDIFLLLPQFFVLLALSSPLGGKALIGKHFLAVPSLCTVLLNVCYGEGTRISQVQP